MNSEIDDLLNEVDKWKFKLHEKLKRMTPKQRAAFWKRAEKRARAMGLTVIGSDEVVKPKAKRTRRATG